MEPKYAFRDIVVTYDLHLVIVMAIYNVDTLRYLVWSNHKEFGVFDEDELIRPNQVWSERERNRLILLREVRKSPWCDDQDVASRVCERK